MPRPSSPSRQRCQLLPQHQLEQLGIDKKNTDIRHQKIPILRHQRSLGHLLSPPESHPLTSGIEPREDATKKEGARESPKKKGPGDFPGDLPLSASAFSVEPPVSAAATGRFSQRLPTRPHRPPPSRAEPAFSGGASPTLPARRTCSHPSAPEAPPSARPASPRGAPQLLACGTRPTRRREP
ncbi:hypothetical protein B0T18DRAFT_5172 [Schizothecium vesticola]|uniref:Uncharacterized protein n=1 Tax=Schizothecium vesticola TaxID=314040 RepID=A0AA40F873_9PEZI|nr:hypothetical protein B0T18DRAFT_5172 [Schizothecium vesticola]